MKSKLLDMKDRSHIWQQYSIDIDYLLAKFHDLEFLQLVMHVKAHHQNNANHKIYITQYKNKVHMNILYPQIQYHLYIQFTVKEISLNISMYITLTLKVSYP